MSGPRRGRGQLDDDPGPGLLARRGAPRDIPRVAAVPGLVVEVVSADFAGAVIGIDHREVVLRDRRGRERRFVRSPGAFLVDDVPVELVPPPPPATSGAGPAGGSVAPRVTNSGSVAVPDAPARVARASRILVEGVHDAALVEQVWGADLRVEGVVVEVLHGADDLAGVVARFGPGPQRRLGILLDHLVTGSKETRLARAVADHPHVLVTGHPYVDVWAAVRPAVLGIPAWPEVPRGEPWKQGVARRLGFAEPLALWQHIQQRVTTWRDLERDLIRAVEELIDFVTTSDEPTGG